VGLLPWGSPPPIAKFKSECSHFSTLLFAFMLITGPSLALLVDGCTVCSLLGILFLEVCTSLLLVTGLFRDSITLNILRVFDLGALPRYYVTAALTQMRNYRNRCKVSALFWDITQSIVPVP
jgi:hypothetical protein